MSKVLF